MLPSADTKFNYAALPTEKAASARAAAEQVRTLVGLAVSNIIEAGGICHQQKEALGHGHFKQWVASEFDVSYETVVNWMRVAKEFGGKNVNLTFLKPSTLYALAAPSTPDPVRTEVMERAANGEKVTAKEIETLKRKLEKAEEKIAEKESQRRMAESEANIAAKQRDEAQNKVMYIEADKERLAEELSQLQEELERATEPGVINAAPVPIVGPRAIDNDDAVKRKFHTMAAQFIGFWNRAPEEWRNEFLLGRYFPDDLAEALNAA